MTILEALKARVNYPLTNAQAEEKLYGRDISPYEDFDYRVAQSKGFRLAYADTLRFVLTMVNLSQGGSITAQASAEVRGTANAIYREYGEPLIGEAASVIRDASDKW
jgi:hypothetical protein